jgi:hypothetical protein
MIVTGAITIGLMNLQNSSGQDQNLQEASTSADDSFFRQ